MATTEVTKPTSSALQRPKDVFGALHDEMERVFERFESGWPRWPSLLSRDFGLGIIVPELDVHDNGKQLMIECDLTGVDEKDVSVTLANGMLTIKGEKKCECEEKKENYYVCERSSGAFERSLRLPDGIDENKVEARFDKGVLKIVAQRKAEAIKSEKKIEVRRG